MGARGGHPGGQGGTWGPRPGTLGGRGALPEEGHGPLGQSVSGEAIVGRLYAVYTRPLQLLSDLYSVHCPWRSVLRQSWEDDSFMNNKLGKYD